MRPVLLTLLLVACGEQKVSVRNEFPSAIITSHADGDVVVDGPVMLIGAITDPDDDPSSLTAQWTKDGVEVCPAAAPDSTGVTTCEIDLTGGTSEIQLLGRDPSNAVGVDVIALEVESTEAPTATILAPLTADRLYTDAKITFQGVIADAEDDAEILTASFSTDLDPSWTVDLTTDSDGTVTGFGYLSEGEHALTLRVEDTDGKTGSDNVLIQVGPANSAPSCAITEPAETDILTPGVPSTFRGTTSDADQPADSLAIHWHSDADGPLSTAPATTTGDITFVTSDLSPGFHVITLTVKDELEENCTDARVIQVDSPPTIVIHAPTAGAVLPADLSTDLIAHASDLEDPATALSVSWESDVDGTLGSTTPGTSGMSTIAAVLSLGDHTLTAEATDTQGLSAAVSVDVSVDDVPVVTGVSIAPNPAYAGDALTCSWVFSDATGSDASTVAWTMDGVAVGTGAVLAGPWVRSNVVECTVTPNDGVLTGIPVSADLVVSNSAPSISSVSILPSAPTAADTLVCSYAGFADADGDSDASTTEWSISGVAVGSAASLSGVFSRGDTVQCTVTPNDGFDAGLARSETVVIENTPPEVLTVSISPSEAYTNTILTAITTTADAEGDPVSLSYAWTVDGVSVAETSSSLDGSIHFDKHQVVAVSVTPNDGFTDGPAVAAGGVTIRNSLPSPPSLSFVPADPVEGEDDVWCAIDSPAGDEDGDTVTHEFSWELDGVPWGGATITTVSVGDTIPLSETAAGQVWACTVTSNDGEAMGDEVTAEVTIDNAETQVFVTQDFVSSDMGGPSGADLACQAAADDAGLGGSWVAYVSGGGATAITRIPDGPYHRLDGELIATDKSDLTDGSIAHPIRINQYGTNTYGWVCTGSSEAGYAAGPSCEGWTRGCGVCDGDHWYVEVGHSDRTSDDWSTAGWSFCGSCRLYCFEQ